MKFNKAGLYRWRRFAQIAVRKCGRSTSSAPVAELPLRPVRPSLGPLLSVQQNRLRHAPRSTAEVFHSPLPPSSTNPAGVNRPAPPLRAEAAAPPPLSQQQEQQVLLEGEEIASVRGMVPIDALPPQFPPAAPAAETQRCGSCGEPNPVGNRFCERCGSALQGEIPVQSAPVPASARATVPAPVTKGGWLDVPAPERPAPASVRSVAATRAATTAAPRAATPAGKSEDFFYFYDDKSSQHGNRKLLIVMMVVLALGVLGVIYLLSRPGSKSAAGANVTITISPTAAQVAAGEAHDFAATVTGSGDTDVTWSVAEGSAAGNVVSRGAQAQGGTVASMGVYVAPATPGTYHVVATSKADSSKSAAAEVLVSGK